MSHLEGPDASSFVELARLVQAAALAIGQGTGLPSDEVSGDQLITALKGVRSMRDRLAVWEPELISAARKAGLSWTSLAPALGVASRQAAERRYLRLRPSTTGESTGEARVEAERAKRAGERAVVSWARDNSAALRQLAGQVSALDDLDVAAQQHADRVQRALADNNPATLLTPLADAHSHLADGHADIADRITAVTDETTRLRQAARDGRSGDTA